MSSTHTPEQRLALACRDFAEIKMVYRGPTGGNLLAEDIGHILRLLEEKDTRIEDLERRINEIRNSREALLNDVNAAIKRFDFTMRSL